PDEEDLEKSAPSPKMRMFGAGIMNNVVIGIVCFLAIVFLVGMITPPTEPIIHGVYKGGPAFDAGVQPGSVILSLNGTPVSTVQDVSSLLASTRPGDRLDLRVRQGTEIHSYTLTLAPVPENITVSSGIGFMGIYYYPGEVVTRQITETFRSPIGILYFIALPITIPDKGAYERLLVIDTVETSYYQVPFPFFWNLVHVIFWTGWINLVVGTFNAIPMVPLDGGYIMKEGIGSFLRKRGWERYTDNLVLTISWAMLFLIVSLVAVPYLFQLFSTAS
ncbi:MAG: M50 family metallopeptidase, partial [Methanomicrobiales archaeon]|nr:M50 family metallopeptidase [Methanomicrobiales archaeon]